jgi:hypothetical protein
MVADGGGGSQKGTANSSANSLNSEDETD